MSPVFGAANFSVPGAAPIPVGYAGSIAPYNANLLEGRCCRGLKASRTKTGPLSSRRAVFGSWSETGKHENTGQGEA